MWSQKDQQFSVDMVETVILDYMSHHCDPELEDSKPIFLHNTLAHDDASPYQVWWQKIQQLRRGYCPGEHSLELWTFFFFYFDLDHNRAIQSFHKTIQLMMICHQTKFSCKRISSSEDISDKSFWSYVPTLWPWSRRTANQSFWKTI